MDEILRLKLEIAKAKRDREKFRLKKQLKKARDPNAGKIRLDPFLTNLFAERGNEKKLLDKYTKY